MNPVIRIAIWYVGRPLIALLHHAGVCSCLLASRGFESLRWQVGRLGAWLRYESARRRVPAYRDFTRGAYASRLADVPVTDKACYVQRYALERRCVGGCLPRTGVVIDESSGSSGLPTNWVRGVHERDANGRTIRLGLQRRFGGGPLFFINAFALGPWATGINITLSLSSWGRVKSLGPDLAKIGNTLRQFGPEHHYVIMGYPPFLKQLVDQLDLEWARYRVSMVFGGEGMSESMRRYLQDRGIARVYGSYGASDLELNIGAETDFTIELRRRLEERPDLAARILRHPGAIPMIFQFNPADFFIESLESGELAVTVCRPGYLAPKVRYNIHDLGHVMRIPELAGILRDTGIDLSAQLRDALDLPLLFLYGRSDTSVAWYGCKVTPADVQEALFRVSDVAEHVDAFQVETTFDASGDKHLVLHLELNAGDPLAHQEPQLVVGAEVAGLRAPADWRERVYDALARVNQDFRESRRMAPHGLAPRIALHASGTGPFAESDIRVKRRYIAALPTGDGAVTAA